MAETVKKTVLDIDASQSTTSIKELRNQLKLLKDQMAGLEEGSDAFLELANKAGTLKHQMDAVNESVRGASSDFGDMLGNATKAAQGVIGVFQVAQGALSLFGVESEAAVEAIKKLQSLMSISQGLGGIDAGIKAIDKLKNSITSTTGAAKLFKAALEPKVILGITAAITALVLIWERFGDSIEKALPFITRIKGSFRDSTAEIEKQSEELHKLQGDYDEWSKNNKIKKLNSESSKSYADLTEKIEDYTKQRSIIEAQQKQSGISRAHWEELNAEALKLNELIKLAKDQQDQILNNENSYKKLGSAVKEVTNYEKDFAYEINSLQSSLENRKHQIIEIEEEEIENADEWLDKVGKAYNFADSILGSQGSFLDQLNLRQQALDSFKSQNLLSQKKYTEATNALSRERAMYWTMYAAQAVQQVGSMLTQLSSFEDTNTREGFERNKKLRIAGATMDMLAGIVSAMVNSIRDLGIPAGPIVGTALSAMVAGLGGAQIANIKKQQFGGSNSYSSPSISTSAISAAQTPIQYTQDIQGISLEESIKSTRVYVVESDIAKASTRVQVQEQENTY